MVFFSDDFLCFRAHLIVTDDNDAIKGFNSAPPPLETNGFEIIRLLKLL